MSLSRRSRDMVLRAVVAATEELLAVVLGAGPPMADSGPRGPSSAIDVLVGSCIADAVAAGAAEVTPTMPALGPAGLGRTGAVAPSCGSIAAWLE